MTLSQAGISIEDDAVRYVSLNPLRYGTLALPASDALAKLKGLGVKFVSAAMPEDKSYVFATAVQSATPDDLADAVAFTIEQNAPVKLAQSLHFFEYLSLPNGADPTAVSVSVLPVEAGQEWHKLFAAAGISAVSFDLRSQAVARALIPRGDKRVQLIIDLGPVKTGLYLVENEIIQFSSTPAVNASGQDTGAIQMLKEEIKKVFLFSKDKKIEHITLTGAGAVNDAFVAALLSDAETPYSVGNPWVNVRGFKKRLPDMPFEESLAYTAAIGTLLPTPHYEHV